MPSRNSIKLYIDDAYYHIYNRGVEKRLIFQDAQDYVVFLSYLKEYLLPKDIEILQKILANPSASIQEKARALKLLHLNNFSGEISLLAYCLMPNHFHFLIKQETAGLIDKFMNSLCTRYTMYFNRKYQRVGSLYQDVYKAVLVSTDEQLLHLSCYIHKQALSSQGDAVQRKPKMQPCSYPEYLGLRKTDWVRPNEILEFFSKKNASLNYEAFVTMKEDYNVLSKIIIEG